MILALGTRLGFNSTFYSYDNINEQAAIIQVELEPTAIGRYFPVAIGIWADARTAAQQLRAELANLEARAEVEAWTQRYKSERMAYLEKRDAQAAIDAHPIQPSGLFKGVARCSAQACSRDHGCRDALPASHRCAELLGATVLIYAVGFRPGWFLLRLRPWCQSGATGSSGAQPDG